MRQLIYISSWHLFSMGTHFLIQSIHFEPGLLYSPYLEPRYMKTILREALWSFLNVMCLPQRQGSHPGVKTNFQYKWAWLGQVISVLLTLKEHGWHCPSKMSPFNSFLKTRPTYNELKRSKQVFMWGLLRRFGHNQKF